MLTISHGVTGFDLPCKFCNSELGIASKDFATTANIIFLILGEIPSRMVNELAHDTLLTTALTRMIKLLLTRFHGKLVLEIK